MHVTCCSMYTGRSGMSATLKARPSNALPPYTTTHAHILPHGGPHKRILYHTIPMRLSVQARHATACTSLVYHACWMHSVARLWVDVATSHYTPIPTHPTGATWRLQKVWTVDGWVLIARRYTHCIPISLGMACATVGWGMVVF